MFRFKRCSEQAEVVEIGYNSPNFSLFFFSEVQESRPFDFLNVPGYFHSASYLQMVVGFSQALPAFLSPQYLVAFVLVKYSSFTY